jgi:molybdopterin molybdotransferase
MPDFKNARSIILQNITRLGTEKVQLMEALGRVLSEDIFAPWDLPLCDNSAMDGYAIQAMDCMKTPATLTVKGYIPAGGKPSCPVESGSAVVIMTGAPIPPGCTAVVPVEETDAGKETVTINAPIKSGQHIRFKGEDVPAGSIVISAGTVVRPAEINMLASLGKVYVPVYRRARVAIISTGDELIEPGETPEPGQIINSNALSLAAAVKEVGAEPVLLGIATDDARSHRDKIREGLKYDAMITSAGVSAGDRDLVREILEDEGVRQIFWRVDIKPGGPTAFSVKENLPVFSLPGNPVSTMVTFELFVRPALLKLMGHRKVIRPFVKGILAEDASKKPGKANFIRVRIEKLNGVYTASSAGEQQTGILKTMVTADALALLPLEVTHIPAGSEVDLLIMGNAEYETE